MAQPNVLANRLTDEQYTHHSTGKSAGTRALDHLSYTFKIHYKATLSHIQDTVNTPDTGHRHAALQLFH